MYALSLAGGCTAPGAGTALIDAQGPENPREPTAALVMETPVANTNSRGRFSFEVENTDRFTDTRERKQRWHRGVEYQGRIEFADALSLGISSNLATSRRMRKDHLRNLVAPEDFADWQDNRVADLGLSLGLFDDRVRLTIRQAMSSYDRSDDGDRRETGSAVSHELAVDLIRGEELGLEALVQYGEVDRDFASTGLPKSVRPIAKRNRQELDVGGKLTWGPMALTLTRRTQDPVEGDGPSEDSVKALLGLSTTAVQGAAGRLVGARAGDVLPDSVWATYEPGRVRPAFRDSGPADATTSFGVGMTWDWSGAYADLSYWRYVYEGRSGGAAETGDWAGSGFGASFGMYGANWKTDLSLYLGQARNGEIYAPSRDSDFNASLLLSYQPDRLPDLDVVFNTGKYETDYINEPASYGTNYWSASVELDVSKFLPASRLGYQPGLGAFYWLGGNRVADDSSEGDDPLEHIIGLYFRQRY